MFLFGNDAFRRRFEVAALFEESTTPRGDLFLRTSIGVKFEQMPKSEETPMDNSREYPWSWWYLLLLAEFIPALWVPFYNSVEPSWAGIPFFYWFQMALVIASAVATAVVYFATERAG